MCKDSDSFILGPKGPTKLIKVLLMGHISVSYAKRHINI